MVHRLLSSCAWAPERMGSVVVARGLLSSSGTWTLSLWCMGLVASQHVGY